MSDRPVVLVTGGSRGIGAAVCRAAAADGWDVAVNFVTDDTSARALAVGLGPTALTVRADVSSEDEVTTMFAEVDERFGRLDGLVCSAGIAGGYGDLSTVTEAMLQPLFAVNVVGAFLCAREAAARMRTDRGGRGGAIVTVSSKAAVIGGAGEWVHYAATKGAIDTMTVGLARELAPHGVRVNGVRPGLIQSDFHLHAPPGRVERMAPTVPMGRAGTADEVAAAVCWLLSPAASYVTGTLVDVTGGR